MVVMTTAGNYDFALPAITVMMMVMMGILGDPNSRSIASFIDSLQYGRSIRYWILADRHKIEPSTSSSNRLRLLLGQCQVTLASAPTAPSRPAIFLSIVMLPGEVPMGPGSGTLGRGQSSRKSDVRPDVA